MQSRNGREAVDAWARGGYDLVLMDCQMPVLDGYAATREIRAREAGRAHIPIVALTANAMKKDEIECRQAGMDDHLAKPLDREALARCLDPLGCISVPGEKMRGNSAAQHDFVRLKPDPQQRLTYIRDQRRERGLDALHLFRRELARQRALKSLDARA